MIVYKPQYDSIKPLYSQTPNESHLLIDSRAQTYTWFIDSGASNHMTNDKNAVAVISKSDRERVIAANGKAMKVIGMGNITKNCVVAIFWLKMSKSYLACVRICYRWVKLFCKTITKLFSVSTGVELPAKMERWSQRDGWKRAFTTYETADVQIWHKRLGHVSFSNLQFLHLKIPDGLKCKTCIRGKQSRLTFNVTGNRATEKLEIVNTDVCGPLQI